MSNNPLLHTNILGLGAELQLYAANWPSQSRETRARVINATPSLPGPSRPAATAPYRTAPHRYPALSLPVPIFSLAITRHQPLFSLRLTCPPPSRYLAPSFSFLQPPPSHRRITSPACCAIHVKRIQSRGYARPLAPIPSRLHTCTKTKWVREMEEIGERTREVDGRKERTRDEGEKERCKGRRMRGWTDSANNALVTQKKGRSIIASPRGRYFSNRTPSVNWRAN